MAAKKRDPGPLVALRDFEGKLERADSLPRILITRGRLMTIGSAVFALFRR